MNSFVSFCLLLSLPIIALAQVSQRAVIYENRNQQGVSLTVTQTYIPNLQAYNFDNRANSICVTGSWIVYVNPSYNTGAISGVEYVFGPNNCFNFATVGGYVSSIKFAGAPNDFRSDTFTLYEEDYFQAEEEYTFTDVPTVQLAGRHKSVIITGRSGWTVYDQYNYNGNSICLIPEYSAEYRPYFIPDVSGVAIPFGTIRSIRKGCIGKSGDEADTNVNADADAASGKQDIADFIRFGKF